MNFRSYRVTLQAGVLFLMVQQAGATAYNYTVDWNVAGSQVTLTNGAIFTNFSTGSGSGVYTSLFRINTNTSSEMGYNYFGNGPKPFDQMSGVGELHANLGDVPVVTINGTQYLQVTMDLNQSQTSPNIRLLDFRVYVRPDPSDTNTPVLVTSEANLGNLGTLVYGMNQTGPDTNTITMTALTGSGTSDYQVAIPLDYFLNQGFNNTDDIYFFMKYDQNSGGFEELAFYKGASDSFASVTPEAETVWGGALISAVLVGGFLRRRLRAKAAAPAES